MSSNKLISLSISSEQVGVMNIEEQICGEGGKQVSVTVGGMALASDGPTEVKIWFKTWATDWLCGREEAPGTVFWIIGMESSAEFLPITLLIVF